MAPAADWPTVADRPVSPVVFATCDLELWQLALCSVAGNVLSVACQDRIVRVAVAASAMPAPAAGSLPPSWCGLVCGWWVSGKVAAVGGRATPGAGGVG